MNESDVNLRTQATKALATIAEMYPQGSIAKKLDGSDDYSYESLIRIWMKGINGLTDGQVSRGINTMMDSGDTFEPALPVFLKMCHSIKSASHSNYKSLPKPQDDNRIASISHYPKRIKQELKRIGLLPNLGESQHEYAMRCKAHLFQNHGSMAKVIGSNAQ